MLTEAEETFDLLFIDVTLKFYISLDNWQNFTLNLVAT